MTEVIVADSVREDAHIVGRVAHGGDWAIAFLIARNCEKREGRAPTPGEIGKVSLRDFAALAKLSQPTVGRWFAQWMRAADAGIVPVAADLAPGEDYVPEGFHSHREWLDSLEEHDWRSFRPKKVEGKDLRTPTDAEMRQMAKAYKETEPKAPASPLWNDGKPGGGPRPVEKSAEQLEHEHRMGMLIENGRAVDSIPLMLRRAATNLQDAEGRSVEGAFSDDERQEALIVCNQLVEQIMRIVQRLQTPDEVEREPVALSAVPESA